MSELQLARKRLTQERNVGHDCSSSREEYTPRLYP